MALVDWIGYIGVFQILLAYFLVVADRLHSDDLPFILLNLIGSLMACSASYMLDYLPFVVLEGTWALVSFYALIKYLRQYN